MSQYWQSHTIMTFWRICGFLPKIRVNCTWFVLVRLFDAILCRNLSRNVSFIQKVSVKLDQPSSHARTMFKVIIEFQKGPNMHYQIPIPDGRDLFGRRSESLVCQPTWSIPPCFIISLYCNLPLCEMYNQVVHDARHPIVVNARFIESMRWYFVRCGPSSLSSI